MKGRGALIDYAKINSSRFAEKIDMVSLGPRISGAHSVGEKVDVKSVEKWCQFFTQYVGAIAEAA